MWVGALVVTFMVLSFSGIIEDTYAQTTTANAGSDQAVASGTTVTLDGSGSTHSTGGTIGYRWTQSSGTTVQLSSTNVVNPTFTAPASATTLVFSLRIVASSIPDSSPDTVTITVSERPTANAGSDQEVSSGTTVTLDGSASTDPESDSLTYSWTKIAGPTVQLSNNGDVQPTFTAPTGPATITLRLEVNDGTSTSTDTIIITVRAPPMADAGQDQTVASGATVTLDGSGSVPAKSLDVSYDWIITSGHGNILSSLTAIQPTFTAPTGPDTVTFTLKVTDQISTQFHDDTVTITVSAPTQNPNPTPNPIPTPNQPPTANAGRDKTFAPGSTVTLNGSGSDPDGDTITYEWIQTPGTPRVTIDDYRSARTTFTAPADPTELVFTFTVSDGTDSTTDSITITIAKPVTRNIKEMSETLVSATITAPNQITMIYTESIATFINSYLNFTISSEDKPRNITGINGSPSIETGKTISIDGKRVKTYSTTLTFDGEAVPAGSTGSMYIQHADHYLAFIHVSDGQN